MRNVEAQVEVKGPTAATSVAATGQEWARVSAERLPSQPFRATNCTDVLLPAGYGRREARRGAVPFPRRSCRGVVSLHPLIMEELLCIECGHPKESHFDSEDRPYSEGCRVFVGPPLSCRRCGCHSADAEDLGIVSLRRFRFHNEWILEADNEDSARDQFADLSVDFAVDADVEELPGDHGEITCSDYEWARINTSDIQHEAERKLGRPLTSRELQRVADFFGEALQKGEAIQVAIEVTLDNMK